MSRIGKSPITLPAGVTFEINDNVVTVKGKLGALTQEIKDDITVKVEEGVITLQRPSESVSHRAKHGLYRALLNNMIEGVSKGFEKKLEIYGVGYRAALKGSILNLSMGYSHPVNMDIPADIEIEVPKNTEVIVRGINKQQVGEFAANIRAVRKPEPYKGKSIRYDGERIIRKEEKTAK